ncbi:hypothetical protein Q3G72_015753 [Acer saccharum]|nr:hypothetical protein Q3G72_015753 [Acer saccharum]
MVEPIAGEDGSKISRIFAKKDGVMAEGSISTSEPTDSQVQGKMAVDMSEKYVNLSINDELIEEVPSGSVQVGPEESLIGPIPSLLVLGDCKQNEDNELLEKVPSGSVPVGPEENMIGHVPSLPGCLDSKPISETDMGPVLDNVSLDIHRVPDPVSKRLRSRKYGARKSKSFRFGDLGISEVKSVGRGGKRKGNLEEEFGSYKNKKSRRSEGLVMRAMVVVWLR